MAADIPEITECNQDSLSEIYRMVSEIHATLQAFRPLLDSWLRHPSNGGMVAQLAARRARRNGEPG